MKTRNRVVLALVLAAVSLGAAVVAIGTRGSSVSTKAETFQVKATSASTEGAPPSKSVLPQAQPAAAASSATPEVAKAWMGRPIEEALAEMGEDPCPPSRNPCL